MLSPVSNNKSSNRNKSNSKSNNVAVIGAVTAECKTVRRAETIISLSLKNNLAKTVE